MREQAQQITYALLRLAPYIRRKELRFRLEEVALNCFVSAGLGNAADVERHAEALLGLVKLSQSLYEVEIMNGDMMIGALRDLIAIAKLPEVKPESEHIDAADLLNEGAHLFSVKKPIPEDPGIARFVEFRSAIGKNFGSATDRQSSGSAMDELPNDRQHEDIDRQLPNEIADPLPIEDAEEERSTDGMISITSAIRQSSILDKIRSMSVMGAGGVMIGCRMKDLLSAFPKVSERTLRNDLQRLTNQERIERHGAGGFSVYVIKG